MKWSNNNGELERVPGTENDPLTLGEKTLLAPELKLMSTELNLNQPPLPGMESLPVTKTKEDKLKEAELLVAKANKKTVGQLNQT